MTTEEKFHAAVNVIRNLPKNGSYQPSHDLMLRFYSYFKQATEGPCKSSKPGFWDLVGRAKWTAWNNLGNMSKEVAMNSYVEELKKIVETMSYTENVATFLSSLDSFYETVPAEDLELVCGTIFDRIRSQQRAELSAEITEASQSESSKSFYNIDNSISKSGITNGTALYSQENETDEEFADTMEFMSSNFQKPFVEPSTCESSPYLYSTSENSDKIITDLNGMPLQQSKAGRDQIIFNALSNTDSEFSNAILASLKCLQNDLDQIIVRLTCIEKQILSSTQIQMNLVKKQNKNGWFLHKNTLILMSLTVLWPFLAHFFIFLMKRRQRRRP